MFNITNGVDISLLSKTKIWKRGPGHYIPAYKVEDGGGAVTLPKDDYFVIVFTENFFSADQSTNYDNAYGLKPEEWMGLLAHEVGHLPQAQKEGGLLPYVFEFLKQYITSGNHDGAQYEIQAECRRSYYTAFKDFSNRYFGAGAITRLLNQNISDQDKIDKLNTWNASFVEYTKLIYSGRTPNSININELIK